MQIDIDSILEETINDLPQHHENNINQHILNSLPPPNNINPVEIQHAEIDKDSNDDDQIRSHVC